MDSNKDMSPDQWLRWILANRQTLKCHSCTNHPMVSVFIQGDTIPILLCYDHIDDFELNLQIQGKWYLTDEPSEHYPM